MLAEPVDGVFEAEVVQVDHQIDGATATAAPLPVHKFGASDGNNSHGSMPLGRIVAVGLGTAQRKHRVQGDGPQALGLRSAFVEGHGSGFNLGLMLTHSFMLMTWLFSVSRSIRAAVR